MLQLGLPVAAPRKPADLPEIDAKADTTLDDEIEELLAKLPEV